MRVGLTDKQGSTCELSAGHLRTQARSRSKEYVQGVKVGEFWNDRLDCRQWGAHFPHVAGIAGQSNQGAQSVVLSGGCVPLLLPLPEGSNKMPEALEACWWQCS